MSAPRIMSLDAATLATRSGGSWIGAVKAAVSRLQAALGWCDPHLDETERYVLEVVL